MKKQFYSIIFLYLLIISASNAENLLDVVVLDAGHGGKDPGAIGFSGTYEKTFNLSITLKLGELIKKNYPYIKLIYTRDKDEFPELHERTRIANLNKAKLFISIHCNHMKEGESNEKNGFEIYILNRDRFNEAIDVTTKENQVIDFGSNSKNETDKYILSTLAQTSFIKYSGLLAYNFEMNLSQSVEILSRGVLDADYWVITGSSMPSVLVECGFISNENDEKLLLNELVQKKIAESLFKGFERYKIWYEL
jgi:N-acetylmuramoyl-L-alanine amidase